MTKEQEECKANQYCSCVLYKKKLHGKCTPQKYRKNILPFVHGHSKWGNRRHTTATHKTSQPILITLDVTCNSIHAVQNFAKICKQVKGQQGTRTSVPHEVFFNYITHSRLATQFIGAPNGPSSGFV